jgi:hypothetical protein
MTISFDLIKSSAPAKRAGLKAHEKALEHLLDKCSRLRWRRARDLNSRYAINVNTISNRAP